LLGRYVDESACRADVAGRSLVVEESQPSYIIKSAQAVVVLDFSGRAGGAALRFSAHC
jgi:hypothetical protein